MKVETEEAPDGEAAPGASRPFGQDDDSPAGDRVQNIAEVASALRMFDTAGNLHLAAICPDGQRPPLFHSVRGGIDDAAAWIHSQNSDGRNIYWQPNAVRPGLASKASASDIAAVRFFQVDIDPPKDGGDFDTRAVVERLDDLPAAPSFIVHSGGGVQAFWRLAKPSLDIDGRAFIERVNASIANATGGDHCHSVAHLMRVPGTLNYPTPAKARRGRGITRATILRADTGSTVTVDEMAGHHPPRDKARDDRPKVEVGEFELQTADTLNLSPFSDIRNQIEEPEGSDRSADAYWLAYMMLRDGFTEEQVMGVLMNPDNPVAAHCLENDMPMRAATRALSAAKRKAAKNGAGAQAGGGAGSSAGDPDAGDSGPRSGREKPDISLIAAGSLTGIAPGEREFIIHKLAPAGLVTMFTAPGGAGKSHIALYLSTCAALGIRAYGLATSQATSIYISCEDDDAENNRRLIGAANAANVSLERIGDRLFLCSLVALRDKGLVRVDLNTNKMVVLPLFEVIRQHILDTGARFVVLDNVAHFFEGNENIRAHVAGFIGLLNTLALETGAAIILISHPNKAGDSYSGSTAFQNQVRSHIHLDLVPNDPDARQLTLAKANYARLEEPLALRWHCGAFRLEAEIPAGESSAGSRERMEDQRFLDCLAERNADQRPVSKHTQARDSYAPKAFAAMPSAGGVTVEQFTGAMERLLATGIIEQVELDYAKPGSPGHKADGLKQIRQVEVSDEPF